VQIFVTPTPVQPTATPVPSGVAPAPKTPVGTIVAAVIDVVPKVGLNRLQAPDEFHHIGISETFFMSEGNNLVAPWLAKSWSVSPDLKQGKITFNEGVMFHNIGGTWGEMTADDVAWSVNDASARITPTSIHGQAGDLAPVVGEFVAVDRYNVEFPFLTFDSRWEVNLFGQGGQGVGVFSKKAYDEKGEAFSRDNIIATGSYKVEEWVRDDHGIAEAVANHWKFQPKVKTYRIVEVPESSTRLAMLRTGEADIVDAPPKDRNRLIQEGFKFAASGQATQLGVFFSGNLWEDKHAITGNPVSREGAFVADLPYIGDPRPGQEADLEEARKVRRAMAMAIDKELVNETVIDNQGWIVHLEYLSTRNPNWQSKWEVPYDVNGAKELLKQTAWPNGFSTALYIGPEFGGGVAFPGEIGDAVAGFWQAIGIRTEVLKYAYAAFRPTVVGRTNTIPWITSCDEGQEHRPWDWPRGLPMTTMTRGGFSCGFESPWIAQHFLKQALEPDVARRNQMTNEWADHMYTEMLAPGIVAVPGGLMYNPKSIASYTPRIGGWWNTAGLWDFVPAR
jgi:ABC-type transport system substrate-binding protein